MGTVLNYYDELTAAMTLCAREGCLFVGQSVAYPGQAMHRSLQHVPPTQRLEVPVLEDFQMGLCTGMSLAHRPAPVCIFPRMDFLLLAFNQLINHLDKLPAWGWKPKVIIRTAVGSRTPLDAGLQHTQNLTPALLATLNTVRVEQLTMSRDIVPAYKRALASDSSTILVEYADRYQS